MGGVIRRYDIGDKVKVRNDLTAEEVLKTLDVIDGVYVPDIKLVEKILNNVKGKVVTIERTRPECVGIIEYCIDVAGLWWRHEWLEEVRRYTSEEKIAKARAIWARNNR